MVMQCVGTCVGTHQPQVGRQHCRQVHFQRLHPAVNLSLGRQKSVGD